MKRELRVMVGIPASGKSTWIKEEVAALQREQKTSKVISRDVIRFSMLKDEDEYFVHEEQVFVEFVRQINEALNSDVNAVFVDATHISKGSRIKLLSKLNPPENTELIFEVMDTPLEECLARNATRTGRACVPETAIRNMAAGFKIPNEDELFKYTNNNTFAKSTINFHRKE